MEVIYLSSLVNLGRGAGEGTAPPRAMKERVVEGGMRDGEKPKGFLPRRGFSAFRGVDWPRTNPGPECRGQAAFFRVVSFFTATFAAVGFGLLEPSAFALMALGFFGANTCSASLSKSGWLS